MPAGRSRSSTLSSTRSPVAHDSQPLHLAPPAPSPLAAHPAHNPFDDAGTHADSVVKSYRSEHSLRTLRGARRDGDGDESDDGSGERGDAHESYNTGGLQGRRVGPQFVIDLATPTDGAGRGGGAGGRPRATTFGGVELPPSPALVREQDDNGATGDDDKDAPQAARSRPTLAARGRSTSVSSVSSLRSLDPSLHLGGSTFAERRPMLYASIQAAAILVVSALGMYLVLKVTLPPIDEQDRDKVKLPKSFDDLKELNEVLQVRVNRFSPVVVLSLPRVQFG